MTEARPTRRREDARLVTGAGTYVSNDASGALIAGFVRSYLAHGTIDAVDVAAAQQAPGIVGAFTADDLDLADIPGTGAGPAVDGMDRPPLARDRVRYVGEPVAVVVGTSRGAVADALEEVLIDLSPLPAATDATTALSDEAVLHPEAGTNVVARRRSPADGDGPPDLDRWPVQVEVEVPHPRLAPVPIEPLSIRVTPSGDGPHDRLEVRCGHQAPHRLRGQLARLLGMAPDAIRVVTPDVGGAFGLRGMLFPEYPIVAEVARRLGQPVHWTETRTEAFQGGTHGRGMHHRVRLAGDREGRIRAAHLELTAEVGAYPHNGAHVPAFTGLMAPGTYAIADLVVDTTIVVTNRAPVGSYRGAGRPEAALAIERAVEAFGRAAGLDAVEVRRRNLIPADALPYRSPTGALYDSGDYPAALEELVSRLDLPALRDEQRRRAATDAPALGVGIAMFLERAGGAPDSSEYAQVEIGPGGAPIVRAGTAAAGQGHDTVWAMLAADVFHLDVSAVEVVTGDTDAVAAGTGSYASRSAQIGGSAIRRCAERVRDRALELASQELEVDVADLELTDGTVRVTGAPDRSVSLAVLASVADAQGERLASDETYSPHAQTFPYGATGAVVEVDRETGHVRLRRVVAVDDCGTVLDPTIVEGQVHGSLAQGVAQALFEEVVYDPEGQLQTATLLDYFTPSAADLPDFETGRQTHPAPSNPLGAKGAGESGCIGAPPAILHAVLDALAPDGVDDLVLPLTPHRVWRALGAARTDG